MIHYVHDPTASIRVLRVVRIDYLEAWTKNPGYVALSVSPAARGRGDAMVPFMKQLELHITSIFGAVTWFVQVCEVLASGFTRILVHGYWAMMCRAPRVDGPLGARVFANPLWCNNFPSTRYGGVAMGYST